MGHQITGFRWEDSPKRPGDRLTYEVPGCQGKRFVIPDVHGCLRTLKALIAKLELTAHDQLFFLGDFIDRGKESRGVVEYILQIKEKLQVYPIRGNHEEDLFLRWELQNKSLIERYMTSEVYQTLFNADQTIDPRYLHFIMELPFFLELDDFYLVHAGFDFRCERPFANTQEMIWARHWKYDEERACGKKIVFGHNPTPLPVIKERIANSRKTLPLDNGCVFSGYDGYGNLLALNLDSMELTEQVNIEF